MIEVVCEKNGRAAMWLSQEQLVTIRKALNEAADAALIRRDAVSYDDFIYTHDDVKYAMIDAWPEEDWN